MFGEINSKKAKRKLEIKELAELATEKINENKILLQTLSIYQQQINIIKQILEKRSKLNMSNNLELNNFKDNSKLNVKEIKSDKNTNLIKDEFISYYNQLKGNVESLRESNKKLFQKYETNNNIIFDDSSLTKIDLNKNRIDIFILDYELKRKNDIIKSLNENLINSKRHTIFREEKRESEINRNTGENYLNNDNLYLQRDLQIECRNYNKCINKYKKKQRKLKTIKETGNYYEDAIKYFEDEKKLLNNKNNVKNNNLIFNNNKNYIKSNNFVSSSISKKQSLNSKRYNNNDNNKDFNSITIDDLGKKYNLEENSLNINDIENENYNKDQTYLPNNNYLNPLSFSAGNLQLNSNKIKEKEKERKKKVKQKFNFLTLDELFDLDNEEGEKEVIIQEELHSDEEIVFEKKIKNKNRINTEFLKEIKKQVPSLYLNQIEFNKKKVMNEADLYSFQRREYNKQDIDQNIKIMKKKLKIMKKRVNINLEKLNTFKDFDKKAKEQYKVLKPIKVLSSTKDYDISFMKKEFYSYRTKQKYKNDEIVEVDEKTYDTQGNNKFNFDEGDSYDEDNKYNKDDEDIDDYSDKMRNKNKKIKANNNKNNNIMTELDNEEDNKYSNNKHLEYDNDNNKAKSK